MNYNLQIATAQRMIEKFGAPVVWRKQSLAKNVDQPWKVSDAVSDDYSVYVVFGSQGDSLAQAIVRLLKDTDVVCGAPKGLLAGGQAFVPEITDQVVRADGSVLVIASIDSVCPGDTPILYKIRFA